MNEQQVRVGVGVIIAREGSVLLGERQGAHGAGTWALPGGHLEFGESIETCAKREVLEETNIVVHSVKPITFTNDIFHDESKHYITLFALADSWTGEARLMEPEKCHGWQWFDWNHLPDQIFLPLKNLKHSGFVLPTT